ncbi:hypothetical protein [Gorillibacterium sp. sgz5001074]|uniref:hypothetical protein n=1 Tax=Gorillibacterium sp. sgz5001074 TaxID=3446695 RepID=UPI003F6785B9
MSKLRGFGYLLWIGGILKPLGWAPPSVYFFTVLPGSLLVLFGYWREARARAPSDQRGRLG